MLHNGAANFSKKTLLIDYHQWTQTSICIYLMDSCTKHKSNSILFAPQGCTHSYLPQRITMDLLIITKPHFLRQDEILLHIKILHKGKHGHPMANPGTHCDL